MKQKSRLTIEHNCYIKFMYTSLNDITQLEQLLYVLLQYKSHRTDNRAQFVLFFVLCCLTCEINISSQGYADIKGL